MEFVFVTLVRYYSSLITLASVNPWNHHYLVWNFASMAVVADAHASMEYNIWQRLHILP